MFTKLLERSIALSSFAFALTNIQNNIGKAYIQKDKYLKDVVSESCEYTYLTFVKDKKKINDWNTTTKNNSLNITRNFIKEKYPFHIQDHKLNLLISERLTLIKNNNYKKYK